MPQKIKLSDGPDKLVTWIWLDANGQIKVEFYDFSETAHRMFGNDIACTITVGEMNKLFSAAQKDRASVIGWMAENFQSYSGVRHWLEEHEVGFSLERESWA